MKKLLTLTLAGICAMAFVAVADAGTALKQTSKVGPTTTVQTNSLGDIYTGHITRSGAGSGASNYYEKVDYGYYVYSNNLIYTSAVKAAVVNFYTTLGASPYDSLLSSIQAESAITGLFADNIPGTQNANSTNWLDSKTAARAVVPGRDAGTTNTSQTDDPINAEDLTEEQIAEINAQTNEDGSLNDDLSSIYVNSDSVYEAGSWVVVDGQLVYQEGTLEVTNNVVNRYHLSANKHVSPIVLDMTGSGVLQASNGQYLPGHEFINKNIVATDFYGDGFEVAMEWAGPQDGLLVAPKADGTVDLSCLFGTAGGYDSGYEKLSLYDANEDGMVSGEELAKLSVWQDANSNAIADAGEVASAASLGITSISLNDKNFVSSFERNGSTYKMWDWWPNAVELVKVASK